MLQLVHLDFVLKSSVFTLLQRYFTCLLIKVLFLRVNLSSFYLRKNMSLFPKQRHFPLTCYRKMFAKLKEFHDITSKFFSVNWLHKSSSTLSSYLGIAYLVVT